MTKKLIVGNWKMNSGFAESENWFNDFVENYEKNKSKLANKEIVICPPVILIDNIVANLMEYSLEKTQQDLKENNIDIKNIGAEKLSDLIMDHRPFMVGAQNCHFEEKGAFTGDISASMVHEVGCEYVILGHSERRNYHHESNKIVAKKLIQAHNHQLIPILCVGEDQKTREDKNHLEFIKKQIVESVPQDYKFNRLVIAYEPIWSIGTGLTPDISDISEMADFIRKICEEELSKVAKEFVILYGGSVSAKNAKFILDASNINGVLVGGASLKADDFFVISSS